VVATPFLFFSITRHSSIPTETPLTGGGVECRRGISRNRDSEPISGSTACCQQCDSQMLSTRRRRTVASCDTYRW